jgi:hypothetical protein
MLTSIVPEQTKGHGGGTGPGGYNNTGVGDQHGTPYGVGFGCGSSFSARFSVGAGYGDGAKFGNGKSGDTFGDSYPPTQGNQC